jgi:YVTN family beta-propeller protein
MMYCSMPQLDQVGVFNLKDQEWLPAINLPSYPGYMKLLCIRNLLITANYKDESVAIVNLATRTHCRLPAGRYPKYFEISKDLDMLATVNYHVGTSSFICMKSDQPEEYGVVKVGPRPVSVAFFSDSKIAAVVDEIDDHIWLVDYAEGGQVRRRLFPGPGKNIVASPSKDEAYISIPSKGRIIAIDHSGQSLAAMETGDMPIFHGFLADGERLFVVNQKSGSVAFIDAKTKTVAKTVSVASQPTTAFDIPEADLLMVVGGGDHTITLLNTRNYRVEGSLALGKSIRGIAYDQVSRVAYIGHQDDYLISTIQLSA